MPRQRKVGPGEYRTMNGGGQFIIFHELIINNKLMKCQARINRGAVPN
jgi:hypothetical protein